MSYAKIVNGVVVKYPYTMSDLRKENPNTSFPMKMNEESMMSWDMYTVHMENTPMFNAQTQKAVRSNTPTFKEGRWVLEWTIENLTEQEVVAARLALEEQIRSQRNDALAKTDWIVLKYMETTGEVPENWRTYRQALRDLPEQDVFPQVVWPIEPTE